MLVRRSVGLTVIAVANLAVITAAVAVALRPPALRAVMGRDGVAAAGLVVRAGQPGDVAAPLRNTTSRRVVIQSVQLIPAPGRATPALIGTVVGNPLDGYMGRGWPIRDETTAPLAAGVGPGLAQLYYSVRGNHLGAFAVLGLRVTYRDGRRERTLNIWAPSLLCVARTASATDHCDADGALTQSLIDLVHARTG